MIYDDSKGRSYIGYAMADANVDWVFDAHAKVYKSTQDAQAAAVIAAFTLDDAKFYAKREVKRRAAELRAEALEQYSAYEVGAWPLKRIQAVAYVDWDDKLQVGPKPDVDLIEAEATAAAQTERAIADRIVANSAVASAFEGAVAGVADKHKAAIDALTTFAAVDAYDSSTGWPSPSITLQD